MNDAATPFRWGDDYTYMLSMHHIGCAVKSLTEAIEAYRPMALSVGDPIHIAAQGVTVCFVELAPGTLLELVEPAAEDSIISRMIKKGITYYHTGYLVENFDAALEALDAAGFRHLNTFHSEAFGMRRCAFLTNPVAHLIEIIEMPSR